MRSRGRTSTPAMSEAKTMTKTEAFRKLESTRKLSTDMLPALRISFESFLRFAQLPKATADGVIDRYVDQLGTQVSLACRHENMEGEGDGEWCGDCGGDHDNGRLT